MLEVTDDGKLPCSEVKTGEKVGIKREKKVRNVPIILVWILIIALLRCLIPGSDNTIRASTVLGRGSGSGK